MTYREPARAADRRTRSPVPFPAPAAATGITVYGCGPDEAVLFREAAASFGVRPTITEAPVSEANIDLARGNRCVSIGHKSPIANSTLLALRRAGVTYVSTRSIGYNHVDVRYAESIGIFVENVSYSPGSVADYTIMLMLMALRHAKSVIRRADTHDYRLPEVPGRELRDLTVGVIGTGRIGSAVVDRLRGFGCRILAYDARHTTTADYVSLDELLRLGDIVTLHTPLDEETYHLLDRRRIERMKYGAVIVNTGRGALLETAALLTALESGRLGGAALDVLEGEEEVFYADRSDKPPQNELLCKLRELPRVLLSPHIAYYTDRTLRDTVENSMANCRKYESGNLHG